MGSLKTPNLQLDFRRYEIGNFRNNSISLSRYFPKGTDYFYGYPAEENSHFYNTVPPEIEELVAARPLACAGPNANVICYPSSIQLFAWKLLHDELGVISIAKSQIKSLSENITPHLRGGERNQYLIRELQEIVTEGKFIMAQPYVVRELIPCYQISPHCLLWFNDKKNMSSYIPKDFLPKRYSEFADGACFASAVEDFPLPCIVKVSSSSAGDGVRICHTRDEFQRVQQEFRNVNGTIVVDEFILAIKNMGIQFGIPSDPSKPIELIGWHEQLTSDRGVFLGGIIDYSNIQKSNLIYTLWPLLVEKILPKIREKGWYGIGGFDVLITNEGKFYFVDPNFRMTGMTEHHCLVRNGYIQKPVITFKGIFEGSEQEFLKTIFPLAQPNNAHQLIYITSLTSRNNLHRFNAGMFFDAATAPMYASFLLKKGIKSSVLEAWAFNKNK